jgi:GMP synthase (glutamine-hydrolysing)
MILLISVCKEKLHDFEFVQPIENTLNNLGEKYFVKNYSDLDGSDLENADKVIICGTSLKDNEFVDNLKKFVWIKDFDKPILGICAGMQLMGMIFGGEIKKKTEIGFFEENFEKEFLGLRGNQEVWHLHNNFVDFSKLKEFEIFCLGNSIAQAVKHKNRQIYGVLFHPEVRNKKLIEEFVRI